MRPVSTVSQTSIRLKGTAVPGAEDRQRTIPGFDVAICGVFRRLRGVLVFLAVLYWVGGKSVLEGAVSLGLLGALITYTMFLRDPFARAAASTTSCKPSLAAGERTFRFLETPGRARGRERPRAPARAGPVLSDVSFTVQPGQMVAIVGL